MLHGLAGHAGEWTETASWLTDHHRVVGSDARGHGRSERYPADVSPSAQVADAAFVIDELGLGPVALVGQSLGGVTALILAAQRPELVRTLVLADAAPSDGSNGEAAARSIGDALRRWPVPFSSKEAGAEFFRQRFGEGAALPWADGLEERPDGWRPRFDIDVMVRTLREMQDRPSWADWESLRCPVLVVRAGQGVLDPEDVEEMAARLPSAEVVVLPESRHDVHLDRPQEWRRALIEFLDSASPSTSTLSG